MSPTIKGRKITLSALSVFLAAFAVVAVASALQPRTSAAISHPAMSPVVLAEYQAWHGLVPTHTNPPYVSINQLVISRHIALARSMGISGFVVDWYGPPAGLSNDTDRAFIDQATAELIRQSEMRGVKVALLYDEGTLSNTVPLTPLRQTRAVSDLLYARRYFTSPAYLNISDHSALFVFPYPQVDPDIDWSQNGRWVKRVGWASPDHRRPRPATFFPSHPAH